MSLSIPGYKVISNVDQFEQAQIICLGETHFSTADQTKNANIIDAYYTEGRDLVLTETYADVTTEMYRKQIECQTKFVTKNIDIKGWDIKLMDDNKAFIEKYKQLMPKAIKIMFASMAIPPILKLTLGIDYYLDYILPAIGILTVAGSILAACGELISSESVTLRNRNMVEVMKTNFEEDKKLFVTGGHLHFEKVDDYVSRGGMAAQIVKNSGKFNNEASIDETMAFLITKRYAILIPV